MRSKFTPETRGALVERFSAGLSLPDAARAVGVNPSTLKGWLGRGNREAEGTYADFAVAVQEARGEAQDRPEPLTDTEFQRELDAAVRAGSVQAMKLWDERDRRGESEPRPAPSKIASLVEARKGRAA